MKIVISDEARIEWLRARSLELANRHATLELIWTPDDDDGDVLFPDPGTVDLGGYAAEAPNKIETEEQRNARIWNEIVKAAQT